MGFHGRVSICHLKEIPRRSQLTCRLAVNAPEEEQTNLVGALREKVSLAAH